MSPRVCIAFALALAASLAVACKSAPTTILLRLEVEKPLAVARLVLTIFDESGQVTSTRLGAGAVSLPGEVVLYPRAAGEHRILARGFEGDVAVGEGAARATAVAGEQVVATLHYGGALLDRDSDGVPDVIDRCPAWPNPSQQACAGADGPRDLPTSDQAPEPDQAPKRDQKLKPDQAPKPDQKPKHDQAPKPDQPWPDLAKPTPDLQSAACASATGTMQSFDQGMVGCAGKVGFTARATLCAVASRVCTAAEWVARRGGKAPTHAYWTDDALAYQGTLGACYVVLTGGQSCPADAPMRVCPSIAPDPLGNACKWVNCGWNAVTPNEFFGGCYESPTAGSLCCPK